MVHLASPPTHHRYLAEIKNLMAIRSRPISIHGRPRASLEQIRAFLGAQRLTEWEIYVPEHATLVVMYDDSITLKWAPSPFRSC